MAATPLPTSDTPPEPETERLADLDSRLAGDHGPAGVPRGGDGAGDDPEEALPLERVDRLLRLNQLGAAWRESAGRGADHGPPRIDRFEIVREVGQGGFATVYEASDTLLGRRVALKVAHPEALVSPALKRRFIREAELAARVVHPNLVTIYDIGQRLGMAFIAEEFCAGGTLAAWLERHPGPVAPKLAAEIVKAVAEGLDSAHGRGIIHRDIKPENILLAAAAEGGLLPGDPGGREESTGTGWSVKLGDFGLGALDEGPDALSRLTRAGASVGTPAWMAPEQIDRTIGAVGPATDVHALGLLLDRLLVGRCRWAGATDSETMRLILLRDTDAVDRPVAGVPRDLAAVCRRCLARTPGERYSRAGEVAADLGRFLVGVPTHARPLSAWQRAGRIAARHPLAVAGCAAVLAAVLIAGVALWGWSLQSSAARHHQESLRRIDAALVLQRGFADLAAGNAAAARERFATSAVLDPALAASFAGRWARRRVHGEWQVLFGDPAVAAAVGDPPRGLHCVAVSADGTSIAAGAADGRLIILPADARSAAVVVPRAHDEINDVAFSPDGRLVATAGEDGRVRLFTAATGKPAGEIAAQGGPLFALAFSPDGRRLAWAGAERVLSVGSPDGTKVTRHEVPFDIGPATEGADVEAALFAPAGAIVVAGGSEILLLNADDGQVIRRFAHDQGTVTSIDLSPDGTRLVSAGTDLIPRIWDLASGRLLLTLPAHPQWVQGCAFTADGTRIATGCRDGVLQVFDAATGLLLRRLPGHVGRIWDVRRESGGTVLTTGADTTVRRWHVAGDGGLAGAREWPVAVDSMVTMLPVDAGGTPDGTGDWQRGEPEVIVVRPRGAPLLFTAARGTARPRWSFAGDEGVVDAAIDAPRGRLAVVHGSGLLRVLPIGGGTGEEQVFPGMHYRIAWTPSGQAVTVSPGEASIASGYDSALANEVEIDRVSQLADALAIAPDGGAIAAGGHGRLRITPIARRGAPRPMGPTRSVDLAPSFGNLSRIAWAPDGRRLAVGSTSGNVRILAARDGATLEVLSGHRGAVRSLAWSADGRVVISADSEMLRVTDSLTAVPIDFFTPGWSIRSVALAGLPASPDRWLVIGGEATEARPTADGVRGRGRLLLVDLGE